MAARFSEVERSGAVIYGKDGRWLGDLPWVSTTVTTGRSCEGGRENKGGGEASLHRFL